jgi:hypothetical protein
MVVSDPADDNPKIKVSEWVNNVAKY